jgi:pyruvate/2-oxoglutarate dehydrogenase complex dihydrolipoamide acyltransferase (E2) component
VAYGQPVAVIEAMKMEVQIESQCEGIVHACAVDSGALCVAGQNLVSVVPPAEVSVAETVLSPTGASTVMFPATPVAVRPELGVSTTSTPATPATPFFTSPSKSVLSPGGIRFSSLCSFKRVFFSRCVSQHTVFL